MGKGILLEVEGRDGVVLTPGGEFKRVPLPRRGSFDIGDELAYAERRTVRWGWLAAAAAVLLMVLSPFGYQSWALAQPVAMVLIDINPSIELTVNGREQVIEARGLNTDGKAILEGLNWRKQPVEAVTRQITAKAVAAGKLDPTDEASAVAMAVAPVNDKPLTGAKADQIAEHSRSAVQGAVQSEAQAKGKEARTRVAVFEATADEVKEAREMGMTLPKWVIYQEIKVQHPDLNVDEAIFQTEGPGRILKGLNLNPGEIFGKAEERHNKRDGGAVPATGNGNGTKPENSGAKENPGKSGQENPGKGSEKQNEQQNEKVQPAQPGNQGQGKGSAQSKGFLHDIKVRLGLVGSDDEPNRANPYKNGKESEKVKGNPGHGEEKGGPKANEGSKGK